MSYRRRACGPTTRSTSPTAIADQCCPLHRHALDPRALGHADCSTAAAHRAHGPGHGRRAAELGDFQLSRVTADFLRAIPIDRCHLDVEPDAPRPARPRPRSAPSPSTAVRAPAPAPSSSAAPPSPSRPSSCCADEPVDPTRLREHCSTSSPTRSATTAPWSCASGQVLCEPGSGDGWLRLRGQLVAGEAPSPAQRVAVAADAINGVGFALDIARWTFVNADLTVYLHRELEGEYVRLRTPPRLPAGRPRPRRRRPRRSPGPDRPRARGPGPRAAPACLEGQLDQRVAAVGHDVGRGHERRLVGREEHRRAGDLVRACRCGRAATRRGWTP